MWLSIIAPAFTRRKTRVCVMNGDVSLNKGLKFILRERSCKPKSLSPPQKKFSFRRNTYRARQFVGQLWSKALVLLDGMGGKSELRRLVIFPVQRLVIKRSEFTSLVVFSCKKKKRRLLPAAPEYHYL